MQVKFRRNWCSALTHFLLVLMKRDTCEYYSATGTTTGFFSATLIYKTVVMWPCRASLSAAPCLCSVPSCPIPPPPPWVTSQSTPLSRMMIPPPLSRRPRPSACDTPVSRARLPPATVNGTAHCGAPGAQSWTATWAVLAPASSAQ